jgi:hypothetical protein
VVQAMLSLSVLLLPIIVENHSLSWRLGLEPDQALYQQRAASSEANLAANEVSARNSVGSFSNCILWIWQVEKNSKKIRVSEV